MKRTNCFVFDTNIVIIALLFAHSNPRFALNKAFEKGNVAVSDETFWELSDKLLATKFEKYVPFKERMLFLQWVKKSSERVNVSEKVVLCRDPKDDKFLSLAVTAKATAIISGDKDLLVLNPFKNISIITPIEFLKKI